MLSKTILNRDYPQATLRFHDDNMSATAMNHHPGQKVYVLARHERFIRFVEIRNGEVSRIREHYGKYNLDYSSNVTEDQLQDLSRG